MKKPMFHAYKNRIINFNKPVLLYKNLHNGMFSLKQDGLVVAHTNHVTLRDVCFIVNEKNRLRVIAGRQKNVHAFVKGYVVGFDEKDPQNAPQITYNPYKYKNFVQKDTGFLAGVASHEQLYCDTQKGLMII